MGSIPHPAPIWNVATITASHSTHEHSASPQPGLWAPGAGVSVVITGIPIQTVVGMLDPHVPEFTGPILFLCMYACMHVFLHVYVYAPGQPCVWSPVGLRDTETQPRAGKGASGRGNSLGKGRRTGRLSVHRAAGGGTGSDRLRGWGAP